MDTSDLIPDYTQRDFEDATRALLPKGQYWQDADNQALTSLIEGMATDFKITHDEIELSLLTDFNNKLFGWKISDYKALLFSIAGETSGQVFDESATPNLIYVRLYDSGRQNSKQTWVAFESKRLPHTEIAWIYQSGINFRHQLATCRHIRNLNKYEVTQ